MADPTDVTEGNVGGVATIGRARVSFYVDGGCYGCGRCHEIAPDHFSTAEENYTSICHRQPTTVSELRRCRKALKECPTRAIGDDGHVVDDALRNRIDALMALRRAGKANATRISPGDWILIEPQVPGVEALIAPAARLAGVLAPAQQKVFSAIVKSAPNGSCPLKYLAAMDLEAADVRDRWLDSVVAGEALAAAISPGTDVLLTDRSDPSVTLHLSRAQLDAAAGARRMALNNAIAASPIQVWPIQRLGELSGLVRADRVRAFVAAILRGEPLTLYAIGADHALVIAAGHFTFVFALAELGKACTRADATKIRRLVAGAPAAIAATRTCEFKSGSGEERVFDVLTVQVLACADRSWSSVTRVRRELGDEDNSELPEHVQLSRKDLQAFLKEQIAEELFHDDPLRVLGARSEFVGL